MKSIQMNTKEKEKVATNVSDIIVEPCDNSPYYTIEELWDMMPDSSKCYYHHCIENYRHHKMSQTLKAN